MTKKRRHESRPQQARNRSGLTLEESRYLVPLAFLAAFIALVILFSPFIFSDKMLFGSDVIQAGIFFRTELVEYVKEYGAVPQWNPYIFGGMPYVEAFHGDIFYPFSFLKYFGSIFRMLGMVLFWHIFFAGVTMYFAARQFKLQKLPSLLAAFCYMFASYLISLVAPGHDGKIFVTTLFPLTFLFLDRGFNAVGIGRSFFEFSLLGLTIGLIILSPHPQMSYFCLWALAMYTVFRMVEGYLRTRSLASIVRPGTLTVYAVIVGLLLSAIQFYPGYYYTTHFSPRADSKKGWEWATSWSLHEEEAFSQLIPEFAGVNTNHPDYRQKTYYWGKNAFKDNAETVGIITIFMALIGAFFYRRKEAYFLSGLALFAFVYALGATTPIFKLFFYLIPKVDSLRAPSMIMFIFSFSTAVLAGMGMQYLIDSTRQKQPASRFPYLLWGFPGLMLFLALLFSMNGRGMLSIWTSLFYDEAATTMVQERFSKFDVGMLNMPSIQSGAWIAFLLVAVAALLVWLYKSGKAGEGLLLALLALPVVDGVRFNRRFVDTVEPKQHWSPNVVSDFFKNHPGKYRVMNFGVVPEDLLPYFGVEVVVGYHGNQLRWYDDLLGGPGKLNQANPNFLNLVGAEYILFPGNETLSPGYFGEKELVVAANFGQAAIYRNNNALPRVFLMQEYRVVPDRSQIYELILGGTVDPADTLLLEEAPVQMYSFDSTANDSAWVQDYQANSVSVGVTCDQNKILVLTDNYFDAWKASVDGQPAKVLRTYGSFRGVEIPAGTRQVVFEYKSGRYATGRLITLLTSLYLAIILAGYLVVRTRKGNREIQE